MNFFIFGEKRSCDYGIYISGSGTFNAPERDEESVEIPGRNGDLIISRNRFKNITVKYPAFIRKDFTKNVEAAKGWLLYKTGYLRMEDTYHPDYYRMAQFKGPIDFDVRFLNRAGETTLLFNCKPQRWRKDGESPIKILTPKSIYNDAFPALPLIKVNGTGAGNLYVGAFSIKILELEDYIMLDSDLQDAYRDTQNKNSAISTSAFPVLETGENTISWDGGIENIEITPRWWTL